MKSISVLFALLAVAFAPRSYALFGMADTVIVVGNPAQDIMWAAKELPQWIKLIDQAKQQVNNTREMVDVVGHPEKFADMILSKSSSAMAASESASTLKTGADLIELTSKSWELGKSVKGLHDDTLNVSKTYSTFGETFSRDKGRYIEMAKEKALRAQIDKASEARRKVDQEEFAFQKQTQVALKSAKTQSEIELHQAALLASQQRQGLARSKVEDAKNDLDTYIGQKELEERKAKEMAAEENAAAATKLTTWQTNAANAAGGPLSDYPVKLTYDLK